MQKRLSAMILAKQKSTVAMALSLVSDEYLAQNILNDNISKEYYEVLIDSFKENTLYQNIWIQILDKDLNSIYRSWTDKKGDNLSKIRKDLLSVIKNQKTTYAISVGKFDLSIKAIVPIVKDSETVGILEVISHFNSISKQMKELDIDSVVVLDKKYKKQLKYPFTKIFIDDYYVANFDAPLHLREHLKQHEIEKYFNSLYITDNGYIIVSHQLKSLDDEVLGYYIMFKKLDDISDTYLDFIVFKWFALGLLVIMIIAGIVNIVMFYIMRKQKKYYGNIIDSSTNIVLVNDREKIIDVNKIFFKYFYKYKTLNEFKLEHSCICEFFIEEDGYIQKDMNGVSWIDYTTKNNDKQHKVKIKYDNKVYYFLLGIALVLEEKDYYSVVLSDITNEEKYKIELEKLSITDALTEIGNRRYFQIKIEEELRRLKRYENSLSFIMFDIDYFKKVNDEHGHGVGDSVLVEYTKLISSMLREGDTFTRIGGEEFMIILPHANIDNATELAEKLRVGVENYKKVLPITMSFGVVEVIRGEDQEHIYKRVDDALYAAKEGGRNMVVSK